MTLQIPTKVWDVPCTHRYYTLWQHYNFFCYAVNGCPTIPTSSLHCEQRLPLCTFLRHLLANPIHCTPNQKINSSTHHNKAGSPGWANCSSAQKFLAKMNITTENFHAWSDYDFSLSSSSGPIALACQDVLEWCTHCQVEHAFRKISTEFYTIFIQRNATQLQQKANIIELVYIGIPSSSLLVQIVQTSL